MVAAKENFPKLTSEEFFAWEEQQLEKHEYFDGEIYVLGGRYNNRKNSFKNHSLVAVALISILFSHLGESGCEIGNSDLRIKTVGSHKYVYPDAVVTCDERDKGNTQFITYPCLIIEVLSKSTEAYDRGGKFKLYRKNPMLRDYLLVSSTSIEMELHHKNNAGEWIFTSYQEGDILELKSINLRFPVEDIYRGLTLGD